MLDLWIGVGFCFVLDMCVWYWNVEYCKFYDFGWLLCGVCIGYYYVDVVVDEVDVCCVELVNEGVDVICY